MFREMLRLSSYSHYTWVHEPGKPCAPRLARIGFYYNPGNRMVTCYCCLLAIRVVDVCENIETDHVRMSPQCDMRCGTASDNVPLVSPEFVLMRTAKFCSEIEKNSDFDEADALFVLDKVSYVSLRSVYGQFMKALNRAKKSGAVTSSASIHDSANNISAACVSNTSGLSAQCSVAGLAATNSLAESGQNPYQTEISDKPDFELLKNEEARLKTYKEWPAMAHAEPRLLAETGLFYKGPGDRVQCAFCRVCLKNWEVGDVPHLEHRKYASHCPFLLHGKQNNEVYTFSASRFPYQPQSLPLQRLSPTEFNSPSTKPRHPEFAQLDVRMKSFSGKKVPDGQNIQVLASAGFYHVGPQDNVKCFFCDGRLNNWMPYDDPWVEHEQHFPLCGYLRSAGNKRKLPSPQHANQPGSLNNQRSNAGISSCEASIAGSVSQRQLFSFEPREIIARLASPAVQAVLKIGYSRDIVRQAIEKKLSETGDDFRSTESLVEAVIDLQERLDPRARLPVVTPESRVSVGASSSNNNLSTMLSSLSVVKDFPLSASAVPSSIFVFNAASEPSRSSVQSSKAPAGRQEWTDMVADIAEPNKSSKKSKKSKKKKQKAKRQSVDTAGASNEACTIDDDEGGSELKDAAAAAAAASFESLEDEARSLLEENRQLKDAKLCKICLDKENDTVFLPCGHLTCCDQCAPMLKNCPICRAVILGTIRIYLS